MEAIKERVHNYCNFVNKYILDEIEGIIKGFKDKRELEINPYLNELNRIIKKVKITKKDIELISSIIKKIVLLITNINDYRINRLKEELATESNYLISIINNDSGIDKKKLKNDYKKFIIELIKLQSFIEKHKGKILDFIEKYEIKYDEGKKREIKKEKTRILKVIIKYHNKIDKEINKLIENDLNLNKKSIKILNKIREILIDYPIRFFFKSILITSLISKNNENKYYKKTNDDLNDKINKINNNLYNIRNNIIKIII